MLKWHDFLVEHAKFPFPQPDEDRPIVTADISQIEAGTLSREWKANHAVRDDTLVQKLCRTLENILGETLLPVDAESYLLARFLPRIQVDELGYQDSEWSTNPSEAQGVYEAARRCLASYGKYDFRTDIENSVQGGSSRVDYVMMVDGNSRVLFEAKSPSVMKKVGDLLPQQGIKLEWIPSRSLVRRILSKSALYLGLRQMEWMFFSCHNSWIVCRLVKDDVHPFLAYSPITCIEDSSEPFRAFLGAILSVIKGVAVEPSAFHPGVDLDTITEEDGILPEDDIGDKSGAYPDSSSTSTATDPPLTRGRKRAREEGTKSGLMVTSSSKNSQPSFQVWVDLHTFPNNTLALPQCSGSEKPRLWLTQFLGVGSTGNVWQCHFDNSDDPFAIKIVELLRRSDADCQQRLRNEFSVYLTLEKVYQSGQLPDRITPRCYGAFEGDGIVVLILELCDGTILREWNELNDSERVEVYRLVKDLHSIGIVHGDLEPRNVTRVRGGGFRLIDFSESRKHICKEIKVGELRAPHHAPVEKQKCSELQTLRNLLWGAQPLRTFW